MANVLDHARYAAAVTKMRELAPARMREDLRPDVDPPHRVASTSATIPQAVADDVILAWIALAMLPASMLMLTGNGDGSVSASLFVRGEL